MSLKWQTFRFNELTNDALYKILKLRQEVFVLEQKCLYLDIDDQDQEAIHLIAINEEQDLVAYCRIFVEKQNAQY